MMIKGDIFKSDADVIVHGCNCFCRMGAGIALQVVKYYPEAYREDQKTKVGDALKLGTYTSWTGKNRFNYPEKDITIANAYTQFYLQPNLKPFDYEAFAKVLPKIKKDFKGKKIAMPKIGSGLAGGDWSRISKIIEDVFDDIEIKVYVL